MSKLKVYVAAPWANKPDALIAQEKFEAAGFEVTSHWIKHHGNNAAAGGNDQWPGYGQVGSEAPPPLHNEMSRQAVEDLEDIDDADAFVILNLGKSEGKATELGYATALRMPVVLVGPRTINIFYHLPEITQVETVEDAILALRELLEVRKVA